jgi:predicted nucleotidyltransferase
MAKTVTTQTELIEYLSDFFKDRADDYEIDMAFLYGSRAQGFPRFDSDLDVALLFGRRDLSEEESFAKILDISFSLVSLLKMEVNVLQIHDDFRKPMLYYNVIVMGVPVYTRTDAQFLALRNEAIFNMEDFGIFGLGWQYEVAKRNLESVANGRV